MEFIVDHKTLGDLPYAINLKGKEFTRCRDCANYDYDYDPVSDECIASECRLTGFGVMGDHYCAWGNRRKS